MNTRFYSKLLLFVILYASPMLMMAESVLPMEAMGKPTVFKHTNESYHWKSIAKSRSWGELSKDSWIVYVMSEGVRAYDAPSKGNVANTLHFMEDFYVAEIRGDYMLLYSYDSRDSEHPLNIPKKIRNKKSEIDKNTGLRTNGYIGWTAIDDLLLWSECPRTKDGVYKKIAVVKDVENLSATNYDKIPRLYKDKECTQPCGWAHAYDFYFAYYQTGEGTGKTKGNVLVYTGSEFGDGKMTTRKVGWVESSEYILWNTRVCWEPAFTSQDSPHLNDKAFAFSGESYAREFNTDHVCSSVPLNATRKPPSFPRCPILSYDKGIAKLAVIGSSRDNSGNQDPEETRRGTEILEKSISQINIVFVMDATNSMKSCFTAMSTAVRDIVKYNGYKNNNVKFGVVTYRNYKDEASGRLVNKLQLTDNADKVIEFLNSTECMSAEHNDPQEAMFYGLNYAADNMNWSHNGSNYIILISDVTTKDPDKKGLTQSKIIDKLYNKNINLVAFQARSFPESSYRNYSAQVGDIIDGLLKKYGHTNATPQLTAYQTFMYYQSEKFPYRPMGYKWKNSDDQNINPSELTEMVEGTIKLFISKTEETIGKLVSQTGGDGAEIDPSVCQYLIEQRVIKRCEDLKSPIKISGYSSLYFNDDSEKQMFVPCLFMAQTELNELIHDLESATGGTVTNRRGELQKQLLRLILSYTGQDLDKYSLSNPESIDRMITSIEQECGYKFDRYVKQHIKNPNKLSDSDIDAIIEELNRAIKHLYVVQGDQSNFLVQNGLKYYYILLKDMPFVIKN